MPQGTCEQAMTTMTMCVRVRLSKCAHVQYIRITGETVGAFRSASRKRMLG
jgi:hypothetical protein